MSIFKLLENMKHFRTYLSVIVMIASMTLISCGKDDDEAVNVKPSENIMTTLLQEPTWTQTTASAVSWELGYVFSTSSTGKITKLSCKMPEPGSYTVSLWDQTTKTLLRQKTLEQSTPEKFVESGIDEFLVEKDKKYVISINTVVGGSAKKFFTISNANTNIFPIARGSILVQSSVYKAIATPKFPDGGAETGRMYGFADFTFIPD